MRFNYRLSKVCGSVYGGGAVCFTPDGCALLSPVGHRVSAFHLLQQRSSTFPFSLPSPVQHLALSPDGQLLVVVDEAGRALFVHYPSQHVLFEYAFNGPVACLAFAPSRPFLAVAVGATTLILPRPSLLPSYRPLHVHRRMTLHSAPITCMAWSDDGMYLTTGGEDGVAKVATLGDVDDGWEVLTLAGHRGGVVGAWWGGARTAADEQRGEGQQPLPQPQLRVYTVTKDGALLQWRWREAEDAPVQAKVEASTAAARSSHVARPAKAVRGAVRLFGIAGRFTLSSKHFLSTNSGGHVVSACALHRTAHGVDLLLVAFSSGSFSLYELPSFTLIHALSVSSSSLSAVAVSPSGAWLAVASRGAGSLLVWEWQSESYVLRQQGHASAVAALAFSPDGAYTATGGDDGRVKLWHAQRGFCFKTFAHHSAPVSDVAFAPSNNVLFSASADGAVHAYDLVRYRLFRTFTPPTPCQLSCMALDGAGELVMAGSTDPFDVFVFSVQSGRLLDVLSGHSGPISGLAFSSALSLVLSSSWDGSVRLWDPFEGRGCVDVLAHDSDVLCLALSPSGQSVAAALLNGSVSVWDLRSAAVTSFLEAGKDLAGGRARADVRTAKSRGAGHATSLCWSADGACLLVGGDSRWVCIYDVQRRLLLKRFVLSSNERLDGIKDRLNSRAVNDEADEGDQGGVEALPGARTGERSARRFGLAVRSRCVRFAPTGQQWAAATNEGLLTFALDEELTFDPTDLAPEVTEAAVTSALSGGHYLRALLLALRLSEEAAIHRALSAIPSEWIARAVEAVPHNRVERLLSAVAVQLDADAAVELYLAWVARLLLQHRALLSAELSAFLPLLRRVSRVLGRLRGEVGRLSEDNLYLLDALRHAPEEAQEERGADDGTAPIAVDAEAAVHAKRELPRAAHTKRCRKERGAAREHEHGQ